MFGLTPFNRRQLPAGRGRDFADILFDDFFDNALSNTRNIKEDTFKIDVKDLGNSFAIEAELPGVKKEEVKVEYDDNRLLISVERKEEINEEKDNYIHRERRQSSMKRVMYLQDVDGDAIKAKLEDGILKIEAPKQPEISKTKQIAVE